jgi:hypothetical protein
VLRRSHGVRRSPREIDGGRPIAPVVVEPLRGIHAGFDALRLTQSWIISIFRMTTCLGVAAPHRHSVPEGMRRLLTKQRTLSTKYSKSLYFCGSLAIMRPADIEGSASDRHSSGCFDQHYDGGRYGRRS